MTTADVLDALAREWARLTKAVDSIGDRASTVSVTEEGWSTKDVLAHLLHWATQIAFGLGAQVTPPVYMMEERERRMLAAGSDPPMPTTDESNALAVAHYRDVPLDDVRGELERVVEALVERARLGSDDEMLATDAVPWAPGRPLWQFIAGDTFLHWPLHSEAIEQAAQR